MKRQCMKENITSTLNDLLYLCVLAFYMYLFIYNVLLVCLYALLNNLQLMFFFIIIIFKVICLGN